MFVIREISKYNIHLASIIQPYSLFALDLVSNVSACFQALEKIHVRENANSALKKKIWSMTLPNRDGAPWLGVIFLLVFFLFFFTQLKIS